GQRRGAELVVCCLRARGMEVIYAGLRQTREQIVNAALQEDVDGIGISILSGAHNTIVPRICELLKARGLADVWLLVGGIIPDEEIARLKQLGVAEGFQLGACTKALVSLISCRELNVMTDQTIATS